VKNDEKTKCRNIVFLFHRISLVCIGITINSIGDEKEAMNVVETVHFYFTRHEMTCLHA
jgi:hypothetical protein